MHKVWVLVVFCFGCLPPPPVDSRPPRTAAQARVDKRVVIAATTRPSGHMTTTTSADGTIQLVYHVLQNGRGPHVEATIGLAPDWTIASFQATGKHTMGTTLGESFTRTGDRVTWKSSEEQGDRSVKGPAFFIPIASMPINWLLVPAALKAGGTIALLPGGEAKVERVGTFAVTAGTETKQLVCYRIIGPELAAQYTWFEAGGAWFGNANAQESIVPEGWESSILPLIAQQDALNRARDAALAQQHASRPVSGVAFTNVRVLDVDKGTWTPNQTVLVVGDTIKQVGPTGRVKIPEGIDTLPSDGMGVIPGLIDMHSHTTPIDGLLSIAAGVTTVRDVGNDPDTLDDIKKRFDEGTAIGPQIIRYGFIEGRNEKAAASKITAETPDEAKAAVAFFVKRGYEGIKIYNSVRPELVPLLAAEAHAKGLKVIGHIPVHMIASEAILAGYDGVEHINMLFLNFFATKDTDTRDTTRFTLVGDKAAGFDLAGAPMLELVSLLKQKKTVITPTLTAFQDLFLGEQGKVIPGLEDVVARLPVMTQRWFVTGGLPMDAAKRAVYAQSWTKILAMVKTLWEAKVHVVLGTDHIGGLMLHNEMALYVAAGIPTKDVMRMATLDAARALGLEKKTGSIAAGKRADLVLVDGDPIADIKQIRKTVMVLRGGVIYRSDALYGAVGVKP